MKKLIVSSILMGASLFSNNLDAQNSIPSGPKHHKDHGKMSPEERVRKETDQAALKLSLSSEQKTKWEEASNERMGANRPIKEKMQGSTTPEERKTLKAEMKANDEKFDSKVNGFLSEEQKVKYEAFKKERQNKNHRKHEGM